MAGIAVGHRRGTNLPTFAKGERFLKGPIPWSWLSQAAVLPGRALQVAMALWHLAGMRKSATVSLSTKVLSELGVQRQAGYRGLKALAPGR